MNEGRQRGRYAYVGQTHSGKSYLVSQVVLFRHKEFKEPVIIHDPNNQSRWYDYTMITMEQYKKMKGGVYRMCYEDPFEFLDCTFEHFKGGQVVMEDFSNWVPVQKNKAMFKNIVGLRHPDHDIDIHMIGHAIAGFPRYIVEQLNEMILLKTGDIWDIAKDRFPETKRDYVKKLFDEVNADPDPHAWRRVILAKNGTR